MKSLKHFPFLDKLGIILSILCIIHCALTPFIFLLPSLASFIEINHSEEFHDLIFLPVFLIAILSFIPAYIKTKNLKLIYLPLIGAIFLFLSHEVSQPYEAILSILGGSFLIGAHYSNIKHSKCCLGH